MGVNTRVRIGIVTGLTAAVLPALPANAADNPPQAVVAHSIGGYANPAVVIEQGDALDFINADPVGVRHDVTGDGFASATVSGGETAPVEGTDGLAPGSYPFVCSLHPSMNGVLQVVEDGTLPAQPPRIDPSAPPEPPSTVVAGPNVVPTPTSLHATATHLYVTSYAQGAVVRLPFVADGLLGPAETVATGFTNPLGVVVDGSTVFVADSRPGGAEYGNRTVGRVTAVAPDGTRTTVVDGLPNGRHNTNNLAIHEGRLYITNGNSTDDGTVGGDPELPLSGTLLSVAVDARGIKVPPAGTAPDRLTVEATGMRNLYDVAFRPGSDEAWITTNGPDTFDPYGEDTLVKVADVDDEVAPDFGFPECFYDAARAVMESRGCSDHTAPEQVLGLHVSADGLAFGPDGDLYIALFGNFFGSAVVGHEVIRVPIDDEGKSSPPMDVLPGGTPLDLTFGGPGNDLYVADFGTGSILRYPV